jgi:hypothetical protein
MKLTAFDCQCVIADHLVPRSADPSDRGLAEDGGCGPWRRALAIERQASSVGEGLLDKLPSAAAIVSDSPNLRFHGIRSCVECRSITCAPAFSNALLRTKH